MPIDDVPEHDEEDLTTVQGLLAALRAQHNSNLALDPVVAPALPQAHRQSQSQSLSLSLSLTALVKWETINL